MNDNVTWQQVVVLGMNVLQTVALAYLAARRGRKRRAASARDQRRAR